MLGIATGVSNTVANAQTGETPGRFASKAGLFGASRLTLAGPPQGAFTPLHGVVRSDAAERLD